MHLDLLLQRRVEPKLQGSPRLPKSAVPPEWDAARQMPWPQRPASMAVQVGTESLELGAWSLDFGTFPVVRASRPRSRPLLEGPIQEAPTTWTTPTRSLTRSADAG